MSADQTLREVEPTYADGIEAAADLATLYETGEAAAAALRVTARMAREVAAHPAPAEPECTCGAVEHGAAQHLRPCPHAAEPDAGDVEALGVEVCVCTGNHSPDTRIECDYAVAAAERDAEVARAAAKEAGERIAQAIEADRSLPWNGMHHEALHVAARIAREEGRADG